MRRLIGSILLMALLPVSAFSVPLLQIYVEGASYDTDTDTWVTNSQNFKLWVIGSVTGTPGNVGIADARLAIATLSSESGTVILTGTTTGLVADPSTPIPPVFHSSGVGTQPLMSDGKPLPSHGIYGAGTSWAAYSIGNLTSMDSPVGDFSNAFPGSFPESGQINVYTVAVTGYTQVHFDAYNHVMGSTKAKFAPFSHDGETGPPVPEPGTVLLLGAGLVTAAGVKFKRGRRQTH